MKTIIAILKWLGIVVGALIIVAIGVSLILNFIFGRELRQTLKQLEVEGRPLTMVEIKPAPVPDDQNAATVLKQLPGLIRGNTNRWDEVEALDKLIYANSNNVDIAAWPASDRDKLLLQLKNPIIEKYLNMFVEASTKPYLNFNIKYEDGPATILPNLGRFRFYARIISISSVADAKAGNNEAAFEKILEAYKFSNLLTQEPCLLFLMVSIAIDHSLKDCLVLVSSIGNVPADKATAIIKELARHTDVKPCIRALDMERVGIGLWIYRSRNNPRIFSELGMPEFYWRFYPFFNKDITIYLKLISKIQDNFAMPYDEFIKTGQQNLRDKEFAKYPACFSMLSNYLTPNFDPLVRRKARRDANVALVQTGLALKLYKQKYAAYPDSLEKVAPEFIGKVPNDPFTGKALIYRKEAEGFILYSVGQDLKDDGGTPLPHKADGTKVPHDIVWKSRK